MGLGHTDSPVLTINTIPFFVRMEIEIVAMEAGFASAIMMDAQNRIWTFGDNGFGEIGDGTESEHVTEPFELKIFSELSVEIFWMGKHHVLVKCEGDKYWIWGRNHNNECLVGADLNMVRSPQLFDLKDTKIKDVFLGYNNTKIIVFEGW